MKKQLFKDLYPYIVDENVTDIRWNGRNLWIDDITKGRYKVDLILSESFLNVLLTRVAAIANVNFNASCPSLQISLGDDLRLHALHPSITNDHTYVLAIRKTPTLVRLSDDTIIATGYADELIKELLKALVRAHCSGIIIGETGAGKTELQKYLASFLPDDESVLTLEDTFEMRLPQLYPDKDISSLKTDKDYSIEQAIRDALRLLTRYLWIAEARGREVLRIMEGASTGCCTWTSIHAANVWEIPDRILQMAAKEDIENEFYTFFDVGIKVSRKIENNGIKRQISQICFFNRSQKENITSLFYKDGNYYDVIIPETIMQKFIENKEWKLIYLLKGVQHGEE